MSELARCTGSGERDGQILILRRKQSYRTFLINM